MSLFDCILADAEVQCSTNLARDRQRVRHELENRGLSFLTLTLPAFGMAFDYALDQGRVDLSVFPSILRKPYRGKGEKHAIPKFLRGIVCRVFDPQTGIILNEPNETALFAVRQICLSAKKLNIPCTNRRERDALARFVACDAEIAQLDLLDSKIRYPSSLHNRYRDVARVLWTQTFSGFSEVRDAGDGLRPKHGPGATAEKISGNRKFEILEWTERLDREFPLDSYAYANAGALLESRCAGGEKGSIILRDELAERPVRVVTVPKTAKAPRIIAIEPVCMQYVQQALAEYAVSAIETDRIAGGHVNFSDQTINQQLALEASEKGHLATIDLSEASDRVSLWLVSNLLSSIPDFRDAVMACRSSRAILPDSDQPVQLRKFASMGSALCFPMEAMVFFTIIASSLLEKHGLSTSAKNLKRVTADIYVYGDDIIVPVDEVESVKFALELFGLKVNATKSFWNGKFRESCGMDAWNGVVVRPTYIRRTLPIDKRDHFEIISAVSLANQFYKIGWWRSASYIREYVDRLVGDLPHTLETSPGLGWFSYLGYRSCGRWDCKLQRFEVNTLVVAPARKKDALEGYPALLKYFLKRGVEPFADEKHLVTSVRSGTVSTKRRWVSAT